MNKPIVFLILVSSGCIHKIGNTSKMSPAISDSTKSVFYQRCQNYLLEFYIKDTQKYKPQSFSIYEKNDLIQKNKDLEVVKALESTYSNTINQIDEFLHQNKNHLTKPNVKQSYEELKNFNFNIVEGYGPDVLSHFQVLKYEIDDITVKRIVDSFFDNYKVLSPKVDSLYADWIHPFHWSKFKDSFVFIRHDFEYAGPDSIVFILDRKSNKIQLADRITSVRGNNANN